MNTLIWNPLTHNNPYCLQANEGLIFMPQSDRAIISLPQNVAPGKLVGIVDAGGTFDSQPLTINPNGNRINNTATDAYVLNTAGSVTQLLYTGEVYGWKILSAQQTNPFLGSVNLAISNFIEDSFTLNNDFVIWFPNPPDASKHIQLPALEGNKGLYYILVNVSSADIKVRPYSGDKIMGIAADYTLEGQSSIHIIATSETESAGWLFTVNNSIV